MNKSRRKYNKTGLGRRLVNESLILSWLGLLSSRVVQVFEKGFLAFLLNKVKIVDQFVRDKVTGPIFQKLELRKNITKPLRNNISSFITHNSIYQRACALREKFMNASVRSLGIFFLVFGIYAAAIFFLKNYVSLSVGSGDTNDLIIAGLAAIMGVLLTAFGDKSIVYSLSNGVIAGRLLYGVLGVNDTTLDKATPNKAKTGIGISFLLGSLVGVLTMFFSAIQLLSALAVLAAAVAIFNIPELGIMLSVVLLAVAPVEVIAVVSWLTLASYILKCLRFKRNFRFGTADAIFLIMFLILLVNCALSGGEFTKGEWYLVCFAALYFAVKNTIVSERLISQAINALCMGAFLGMVVYLLGEFAHVIPYDRLEYLAEVISQNRPDDGMLAVLVGCALPFAFYSFSSVSLKKRDALFVLVSIGCAFAADSLVFYGVILVSFFVYIAVAYKAPVGALASGIVVVPTALWALSNFTLSNSVVLMASESFDPLLYMGESCSSSFWGGILDVGGVGVVAMLLLAMPFVFQRIFAGVLLGGYRRCAMMCSAVASSVTMLFVMSWAFNLFADLRIVWVFWFVMGLCGGAYKHHSVKNIPPEECSYAEA